eukprot:350404-Chlamydomonas_euryale.AAC.1
MRPSASPCSSMRPYGQTVEGDSHSPRTLRQSSFRPSNPTPIATEPLPGSTTQMADLEVRLGAMTMGNDPAGDTGAGGSATQAPPQTDQVTRATAQPPLPHGMTGGEPHAAAGSEHSAATLTPEQVSTTLMGLVYDLVDMDDRLLPTRSTYAITQSHVTIFLISKGFEGL